MQSVKILHQSLVRYPQLCQTLGALAGLVAGEPPRMPCSQEAAHSASLCVIPEEADLFLALGSGRKQTTTRKERTAQGQRSQVRVVCHRLTPDCTSGSVRPSCGDRHGVGHRQSGPEQHQLSASAGCDRWRRPRSGHLL